jgi:membrane protein DedA with SNARE-associated domain
VLGDGGMLDYIQQLINDYGLIALFVGTAIESSALPFPGAWLVLLFGLTYPATPWQLVSYAAINGVIFAIFSLIPYMLGRKIENFSRSKFDPEKIEKTQQWFQKYGEWSIILARPLSIGNYISFISGICKVNPWRYLLFTFLGVFPWNVVLLFVGYNGSIEKITSFLHSLQHIGLWIVVLLVVAVLGWFLAVRYRKRQQESSQRQNEF